MNDHTSVSDGPPRLPTMAVMDCATLYGAWRWLTRYHETSPVKRFAGKHTAEEDFGAVVDLAHTLMLYDEIVYDTTSVAISQYEWYRYCIEELLSVTGEGRQSPIIQGRELLQSDARELIQATSCRLLRQRSLTDAAGLWRNFGIPTAYRSPEHVDTARFNYLLTSMSLPQEMLALAIFCYRGLACAGMARRLGTVSSSHTVYLAAPQRISVLRYLTNSTWLQGVSPAPCSDLMGQLGLPECGYDFSELDSVHRDEISPLAVEIMRRSASEDRSTIMRWICSLRTTPQAYVARSLWSKRLSLQCPSTGAVEQAVVNSHVAGSVYQTINYNYSTGAYLLGSANSGSSRGRVA